MKEFPALSMALLTILTLGCDSAPQAEEKSSSAESKSLINEASLDDKKKIVYGDKFPEVLAVRVEEGAKNSWRFSVTLSSTYDSPRRYADAWRVLDGEGRELGIRVLGHDHADEQPFTRSGGIQVPTGVLVVFVEGRDKANGWSGQRFEVKMPKR